MTAPSPILAEVRRGRAVESAHRGAVVAVDARGEIVLAVGDPDLRTYARSSIKPVQALPLVADGAAARLGLTPAEIAVVCGSHSGEDVHVAAVRSILRKIGLPEDALQCGGHLPFHQPTAEAMRLRREGPRPVHDNCSGKHAGMLALARVHGWDHAGYLAPDHPVQRRVVEAVVAATGSPAAVAVAAVDGCGAPTYHISLRELATAFARLAHPGSLGAPWQAAAPAITDAMIRHPEMVAGSGRSNTDIMTVAGGRLFLKDGGEAVSAVGVPGRGMGVAVKIEDGGSRALAAVTLEALRRVGVLGVEDLAALAGHARPTLRNRRGLEVGEIRAVLPLA